MLKTIYKFIRSHYDVQCILIEDKLFIGIEYTIYGDSQVHYEWTEVGSLNQAKELLGY